MKSVLFAAVSLSLSLGAPSLVLAKEAAKAHKDEAKKEAPKQAAPKKESGTAPDPNAYKGGRPAGS